MTRELQGGKERKDSGKTVESRKTVGQPENDGAVGELGSGRTTVQSENCRVTEKLQDN